MLICTTSSPSVHLSAQTCTKWQFKTLLPSTPNRDLSFQRMKSGYEQGNLSSCKSNLSVTIVPSPSWLSRLQEIGLVLPHIPGHGHGHASLLLELCRLSELCMQSASQRTPDCHGDYFYQCYHRQCAKVIKFPQQHFKEGRKRI